MKWFILFLLSSGLLFFSQVPASAQTTDWAFIETFDYGTPTTPSTQLIPKTFDYVSTHRSHPTMHDGIKPDGTHGEFPADHGDHCEPPPNWSDSSNQPSLGKNQHSVTSSHRSNSSNPESSFFICNNHLMSSIGDIDGYSVTSFWPRQEFDFKNGGTLEFDSSITAQSRNWWEVLIVPREQTQMGATQTWFPISETYPEKRIVFMFNDHAGRYIEVGAGQVGEKGILNDVNNCCQFTDWSHDWIGGSPEDPALKSPQIRRKHRITIENNKISWGVQKRDGSFHTVSTNIPSGLPFTRGLVLFKTHAYTPNKDGVHKRHTVHWDNIRFSGPKLLPYRAYEISELVKLYGNGSRPIGETQTTYLDLPEVGTNPALLGQIGGGAKGQVLLSINGNPNISVAPHSSENASLACEFNGWRSFWFKIDPKLLKAGKNEFKWTIGPRPSCASSWYWDGFAIKAFEVQFDGGTTTSPLPSATRIPTPLATSSSCNLKPKGDADCDGVITLKDFNIWRNFALSGTFSSTVDFDSSGSVNIADFEIWRRNYAP